MLDPKPNKPRLSGYVATLLVGTAVGAAYIGYVSGSHDKAPEPEKIKFSEAAKSESQGKVYPSLVACTAELGAEKCDAAFAEAQATHEAKAPRFSTLEQCQAEFGRDMCRPNHEGGGSSFMPVLMGVMIGQMLSGGQRVVTPVFSDARGFSYYGAPGGFIRGPDYSRDRIVNGPMSFQGQPAYQPSSGGMPTTSVPQTARPSAPAPSEAVSRGGFGSTAASKGSGSAGAAMGSASAGS